MIVQSILQGVLSKYLDKWFYGITKDNMKAQVLKGRFVISNIGLRESIFFGTNMPYDLRHSYVQKIQLNINWTSNQRVVIINISKIYALLSIKEDLDLDTIFMQLKKSSIKDYISQLIKIQTSKLQAEKLKDKQKKDGGISGFIKKLLDNVHINIKSIHLRFQNENRKYSFGLRIQQILIINVDEKQNPQFFNRQKSTNNYINYGLTIDPLQIYLNPNQTNFLHNKSLAQITNDMIKMSNYRKTQGPASSMFDGINQWNSANSFSNILTISIKGKLKRYINRQDKLLPQFQSSITFKTIQFKFSDLQFHAILNLISEMTWYQGMLQHYSSKVQIVSRKQRLGRQIIDLIRKPKTNKKEKQVVRKMIEKHFSWSFKQVLLQIKKKKFIQQALKNQINAQKLFQNQIIVNIIRKVETEKIKQWVKVCVQMKKKYERYKNFDSFYRKWEQKQKQNLKQQQNRQQKLQSNHQQQTQNQVILKLSVLIDKLDIKISQNNRFGIKAEMKNAKFDLIKRKQNFKLVLSVSDLVTDVFKMGIGQNSPTYVSILKKNRQFLLNQKKQYLLYLQFQKSPIGKPFVFSSTKLDFQSIQITIFPQVLSNLYQIFIKQSATQNNNPNQQQLKKKKNNVRSPEQINVTSGAQLQYNIIEGFIKSPWIVIPLSHTNDVSKDCWVLRLGDLNIETAPHQYSSKSQQKFLYQRYFVYLKSFQLKYFSSIQFFHIWLQYGQIEQTLKKIPGYYINKYINVILPISCSVDLSIMKKHVSTHVKKKMQSFKAQIKIQKVFIRLPKLLLDKLKQRVDVFGDEKKTQDFIQAHPKNILQQNTIQGLMTVSNEKFKSMTFYAVLKGYFLYFFLQGNREEVVFTTDVRDCLIRLTSDHHTYLNQNRANKQKLKKLNIQLKNKQQHSQWKRHLTQLLSKRDRINDKSIGNSLHTKTFDSLKFQNKPSTIIIQEQSQSQILKQQDLQRIIQQQVTLLNLSFVMESLQIQLIDQNQNQFLHCIFKKTKFNYSNTKQKLLVFSILQWQIIQKQKQNQLKKENNMGGTKKNQKKNIPFLSCKRLFTQKAEQQKQQYNNQYELQKDKKQQQSNFLQVKVFYNHITGQLSQIGIKVDQLYISWNIPIFNKILRFFFYKAQMNDLPTAPSTQKRSLLIKFQLKKFYLYCFHDQQLIALFKLHQMTIDYSQNNIQEKYIVKCQKFQTDKYVDNDQNKRVPMIICPKKQQAMRKKMKSFQMQQNEYLRMSNSGIQNKSNSNRIFQSQLPSEGTNPMLLKYTIRKLKTDNFVNITKLKKKFGQDLLVSEIQCNWQNFLIFFDQEQTLRLVNYFINQILGTVGSKFKKKQYSLNYISQTLKFKKITTFKVQFKKFIVMLTPHSRTDHFFEIKIDHVNFTKNIRDDKPEYEPKLIHTPTKRNHVTLFYDTMVFQINNVNPYYRFKDFKPEKLTRSSFNILVTYSKLNFSRQYEPILNSLNDIDRTVKINVKITPGFQLEFQKITFLTFLRIFYQNIKHRDGKAQKFETPHQQPALKIYNIDLGKVDLYLYQYVNQNQNEEILPKQNEVNRSSVGSVKFSKNMKIFQQIHTDNIKILYKNQGQNSDIQIKLNQISASGQLPVECNNINLPYYLLLNMNSVEGQTFLKLVPQNLQLSVNLDKLNHVIQFTNYDSDYTSNKIMPKKKKDSFMTVNVFPQKCCVRLGELQLYGNFYITYTKDFKNPVDKEALPYLFNQQYIKKRGKSLDESFIHEQVADKQIKVNGQNLVIFINKKHVGDLKRLFFGRTQYSSKQTQKRFRKENAVIDGLSVMVNILQLMQIYKTYEQYIKKSKDFKDKILILPQQEIPFKPKLAQKRKMQVQFQRSYVNIMRMLPQKYQKSVPPFMSYMTIQFYIPKILYQTQLQEQFISITDLGLKILQFGGHLTNNKIFQLIGVRLHYVENKQLHKKYMKIQNAKNIRINIRNMNQKLFALFGKQLLNLKELKNIQKSRNINRKILSESTIPRQTSFSKIEFHEQRQLNMQEKSLSNYFLIIQNLSSKNIQVIINNFKFSQDQNKAPGYIVNSKQVKIFEYSGIKLLEFLDQSSKQKNLITQVGFKQIGYGPIIRKSMKQIFYNGQVQLFSSCHLKYKPIPNGIKLQIFQPYLVTNMTLKPILICLLNKKKVKLNNDWVVAEPCSQVAFSNIDSTPYFIIMVDYTNKTPLAQIDVQNFPIIQISQLPTNLYPNRVGPLHLYPSYLMEIIRWQNDKNSNKLKLIIFNRFRLQNNLPLSMQANYTTVQNFRQAVIESTSHASSNSSKSSPKNIRLRVESLVQLNLDLTQGVKQCQKLFVDSKSKPKKHQTANKQYKIQISKGTKGNKKNQQLYYRLLISFKVGYLIKNNEHSQLYFQNENKGIHSYMSKMSNKISSTIQNFISYNQIVISVNCSKLIKNASILHRNLRSNEQMQLRFGWVWGNVDQQIQIKRDTDYSMMPDNIKGIYFDLSPSNQPVKPQSKKKLRKQYKLQDLSAKQSINLFGKYLLNVCQSKLGKQKQLLLIVQDVCVIQNKTSHIIEITSHQNTLINGAICIYPKQKANIPLMPLFQEQGQSNTKQIEITAYCKSTQRSSQYHLGCTTKLQLANSNRVRSNTDIKQNQKCSRTDVYYWSLNPQVAYPPKQYKKYQSQIIKITSNYFNYSVNNSERFLIILENEDSQKQPQQNEIIQMQKTMDRIKLIKNDRQNAKGVNYKANYVGQASGNKENKLGYKFNNNLPKNYAVVIRQQKGILPELCPIKKQYQKYYDEEDVDEQMIIPFDIDDYLPPPSLSHRKFSHRISDNQSCVNQIPLQRKQSIKFNNKLVFQKNNKSGSSSRSKIVQYLVEPNQSVVVGLTNLQSNKKSRIFILQIYRTDCNLQFDQKIQIRLDEPQTMDNQFIIKQYQNKLKKININMNMNTDSIELNQIQSVNSQKSSGRVIDLYSKKKSLQSIASKFKGYKILVHTHKKKKQQSYQFFVQSKDLQLSANSFSLPSHALPASDYERTLQLKIFQISLTIYITSDPKDTLTLQLQNLYFKNNQLPPSSHLQKIELKIDKLLIRQDKNLSILQMLNDETEFLSVNTSIQKVMIGNKFNNLHVKVSPIQLNIRQGILFKILSRVVQLRNHYFFYGQKLDQIIKSQNSSTKQINKRNKNQTIFFSNNYKFNCRTFKDFENERDKFINKELKKSSPKILIFYQFNLQKTSLYLSFSKDDYVQNKEQFIHDPFIKYFILIPAVSQLKVDLPKIQIKQFKGVSKQFGKNLLKKMKPNIGGTVIRSLSSLSVLDSPVAALDGVFQYLQAILMINKS